MNCEAHGEVRFFGCEFRVREVKEVKSKQSDDASGWNFSSGILQLLQRFALRGPSN